MKSQFLGNIPRNVWILGFVSLLTDVGTKMIDSILHKKDREIFQSIVWGFQLHMLIVKEPDLISHWDYCYERSLGCVGILKNWLKNAYRDAITEGANTVEMKRLILNEIAPYLRLHKNSYDYQTDNISHVLGIKTRRAALNGTGLMASKLLRGLSKLTQIDKLHFLTVVKPF
ncbi:MAG: hypothetical protein AAFV71_19830 [Cyanobacteria bacterium J06633_8]